MAEESLLITIKLPDNAASEPSHPGHGSIISPFNGPLISPSKPQPNPFYQTMPAPETWHRDSPSIFPFGETAFMEREIGRGIAADLDDDDKISAPTPVPAAPKLSAPWVLPEIAAEVVDAFLQLRGGKAIAREGREGKGCDQAVNAGEPPKPNGGAKKRKRDEEVSPEEASGSDHRNVRLKGL